jgi:Family of unknown function (DUF5677)
LQIKLEDRVVLHMSTNPALIFGRPEFAKEIQAAFPRLFEVLPRLTASLSDLTGRACKDPEPYQRMIVNLGLLTGVSMMELVTLAGNGFGQGAMKIARTVMETAVNAEYLRQFPTEFESYINWYWIEKNKDLTYAKQHLPHLLPSITQESIDTIEREYQAVRPFFEKPNGELRSSWCSLNLADRAARTGFAQTYKLINPLSSALIHGTFGGLARHFDMSMDEDRIALPPSLKYCAEALVAGHACTCQIVETIAKTFGWEPVHTIESLVQDFHYAWPVSKPPDDSASSALAK